MKNNTLPRYPFFVALLIFLNLVGCSYRIREYNRGDQGLEMADHYFEQKMWKQAIMSYESFLSLHPENALARFGLARSFLAENMMEDAFVEFQILLADGIVQNPEVYFWAGRTCHRLGRFEEAASFYRKYVEEQEGGHLDLLSFYLRQIGSALKAGVAETKYLVENVGKSVNSSIDEFHPVYSPNFGQRFYYSIHDAEDSTAIRSASSMGSSMKFAEVDQGIWESQGALDPDLNKNAELRLLDFTRDGKGVIFSRATDSGVMKTYHKSFEEQSARPTVSEWLHPVFKTSLGDRDLFTIHDSAYLFSSKRLQGYGGFDLFVTFKRVGEWVVQNLGPVINSRYDEITPFLSRNGREIYFSSNSDKSIGGYDVFFATFDDAMESWLPPQNLMPPLNSGMNDVELRLSADGQEALFSSDRQDSRGGFDIFQVFFDQPRQSQTEFSLPRYFYQVRAYRAYASQGVISHISSDKPVYLLPVIHFGDRPVVITSQVRLELDQIVKYGLLFPHTGMVLHIFTEDKVENGFALFKPVLNLKKVVDYLKAGGIDPSRIQMRLYGNQYTRYGSPPYVDDRNITTVHSPNGRLEVDFTRTSNLPVQFGIYGYKNTELTGDSIKVSSYQKWKNRTEKLYFRIRLIESKQLLQGTEFVQCEDLMMVVEGGSDFLTYYGGIFQEVEEAKNALKKYIAQGYLQAEIVAFIGGTRISSGQMSPEMIQTYPELKKYIIYQN